MSTRAQVRFATREEGVTFSEHPNAIHAQFYVHSDGYPEGLGLDIAQSYTCNGNDLIGWEIEHVQTKNGDLEYIYYIWCDSCNRPIEKEDKCIFVGSPRDLIERYTN